MGWFGRSNAKVVDEGAVRADEDAAEKKEDPSNSKESKDNTADDDTGTHDKLDDDTTTVEDVEENEKLNAKVQDIMTGNLDVMRDIVFRIREEPEYAKSIYVNCPRLQELLKKHPDLRPIFEDPKLVLINFEKVYRDQGGILPEDEDDEEPGIVKRAYEAVTAKIAVITSHPIFKIFKIFMIIKKIMGFFSPTKGFGVIKGFVVGLFEDPDVEPPDADGDGDADEGGNPANLEAKMQLNAAAEHMEDPEVQERMEEMIENPDSMEETIENDPQLKALRDENPLCAELMADPETMKVLTDPDNLRALGEAPDLIELDFSDPGGFVPEEIPDFDADIDAPDVDVDADVDAEAEETAEAEADAEEEEGNMYEDMADDKDDADKRSSNAKGGKNKQDEKKEGDKDEAKTWMQAAAGIVGGQALDSLGLGEMLGGDDPGLGGAPEIVAPEIVAPEIEAPEIVAPEGLGMEAELPTEDPTAEGRGALLEEVAAEPEAELAAPEVPVEAECGIEVQDMEADVDVGKKQGAKAKGADGGPEGEEDKGFFGAAVGAGVGLLAATTLGSMISSDQMEMVTDVHENYVDRKDEADEEEEEEGEDGENKPKSRFAVLGAMQDFAKDQLISDTLGGVLGDDLAGDILDTQEEIEEVAEEGAEDEDEDEEVE